MYTMDKECLVYQTADFISKRWALLILLEIYRGNSGKRFSQLKKNIPKITAKVLSMRLKELENQGLIRKEIDASKFPVNCSYTLTKSGSDFINVIKKIKTWAIKWKKGNKACEISECSNCI